MAEPERLLLADGHDLAKAGAGGLKRIEALAFAPHGGFELKRHVEIVD